MLYHSGEFTRIMCIDFHVGHKKTDRTIVTKQINYVDLLMYKNELITYKNILFMG